MRRLLRLVGVLLTLGLATLVVAAIPGWWGGPATKELGPEALAATEAYCRFMADVQTREQARAAVGRELELRQQAVTAVSQFTKAARRERPEDQALLEEVLAAGVRFRGEMDRFERLRDEPGPKATEGR
jgi:hypothetical protein